MLKGLTLGFAAILFGIYSLGQCLEKDAIIRRVDYIQDSSNLSLKDQQTELLSILKTIANCPLNNDSTHVMLLRRIGGISYLQGDYVKAAEYYEATIQIMTDNTGNRNLNPADKIISYYWLSVLFGLLNNSQKKMEAADSCIAVAMRLNRTSEIHCIRSLYAKIEYLYDQGDYYRCIDYATRCEALAKVYSENVKDSSYRKAGITLAESSLGWRIKALFTLNQYEAAEKLLTKKVDEYKKNGLFNYLGNAHSQLAVVQLHKGNYDQALFFYNAAFKYDQEAGYYFNCKQTLKDIGYSIYCKYYKNYDKALLYYRKALSYINKDKNQIVADRFESLDILTHIANLFVAQGSFDSAQIYFKLAFDQINPGIGETDILRSSPDEFVKHKKIYYLTNLLISKGDAFKKQYEHSRQNDAIRKAISIYMVSDKLLDRIKSEQSDLGSKLFWRSDTRRLYESAIDACYLSNDTKGAFYFFEKSRAVLLNDLLNQQRWLDEKDIMKQTELQKKILQTERDITRSGNTNRLNELQSELFTKKHELDLLQQQIKTINPLYYQNFLDTGFITIGKLTEKLLVGRKALIELFAGDSAVYSLIISTKNVQLNRVNKKEFDSLTALFINYISNSSLQNKRFSDFVSISSKLYQLIFSNQSLEPGRIIISPDGQYFPFEALVIKDQPVTYLLENYAVSYTYSARYLMNEFANATVKGAKTFMGVAPVQYPAGMRLASLSGSDRSLKKLKSYLGNTDNHITSSATRENFLDNFYRYRIIQLYTHSSDSSDQGEPVIYFADSALYLSDLIRDHRPNTSLIVLSACETGKGKVYQGEGVFSFNRGFAALGIPAAITNLWSVDNESTYILTELFYKWLAKGLPTDVALQKAKLEFLQTSSKERSLPYYWAGPVLVGKAETIELNKPYPWTWIAGCAIVVLVVFWFIRKRYSQGKKYKSKAALL